MKRFKVITNNVGKYNLLSNEEQLMFILAIQEDGKTIKEGELPAQIRYYGSPDEQELFVDPFNNLEDVISLCLKNSKGWISSTDYYGQYLLFVRLYKENYNELVQTYIEDRNKLISQEIERLNEKLNCGADFYFDAPDGFLINQLKEDKKMISFYDKKLADLLPESETYNKELKYKQQYVNEALKIEELINIQEEIEP